MTRLTAMCMVIGLTVSFAAGQENERKRTRARKDRTTATASASAPSKEDALSGARAEVYKKVGDVELKIHFFMPPGHKPTDRAPAVVFFFGGGWLRGSPGQFVPQCKYFASRGMVAATADYRVFERHHAMVADCTADAESAMRWVRANAKRLGVAPDRIASSGGSAGGHLAAAVGTLDDMTGDADKSVSFRPNAMILFNPAADLTRVESTPDTPAKKRFNLLARLGAKPEDLSPADHVKPGLPPTIIFHGKSDNLIPIASVEAFAKTMKKAGNKCEVVGFEGQGHGFFNYSTKGNRYFGETMRLADRFLASLGWLKGDPTISGESESQATSKPG